MDKVVVKSIVDSELQKEESWCSAPFWSDCAGSARALKGICASHLMPAVGDTDFSLKIRELSLYESETEQLAPVEDLTLYLIEK